jgi:hypothetical protein
LFLSSIAIPLALKSEDSYAGGSDDDSINSNGTPPSSQRRQQTVDYLVSIGMPDRESMESRPDTPHYKAVSWIADEDDYQFPIPVIDGSSDLVPHTRFTERYVLAVLYYTAGGQFWKYSMRFLEPIDHCEWYQDFVTTSGSVVRLGVTYCATLGSGFKDRLVHHIDLCKLVESILSALFPVMCGCCPFRAYVPYDGAHQIVCLNTVVFS